jgi:predicted MFS family arabinose efflux permease
MSDVKRKSSPVSSKAPGGFNIGWIIWSVAVLFYAYQFALRIFPSVISQELMSSFAIGTGAFGLLASFYYYGYAFFQVPAGTLLDRFGTRRVLLYSIAGCVIGNALLFLPSLWTACIGRLLVGLGSAGSFLACIKVATDYFDTSRLSLVTGLSVFIGTLGAVGGGAPIVSISKTYGWHHAIWVLIALGVALLVFGFYILKDRPQTKSAKAPDRIADIKALLGNTQTWIIGLYGILMYIPLSAFCDLWGVPFLTHKFHLDPGSAAFVSSAIYIGLGLGAPLSAYIFTLVPSYRLCFLASASASTVLFCIMLFATNLSLGVLLPLGGLLGVALSPQILAFTLVCRINAPSVSATASGLHNTICMLSGIIAQPLVGALVNCHAGSVPPSASSYQFGLMFVCFALLAAGALAFGIKEPHDETLRA